MTTIGRADLILGANTSALLKGLSKTKKEMKKLSADAEKMSKKFAKVGAVFGGFAALSVKTAAGFEQSMARVGAITGSVGEEFDQLTATARDLAAQTKFTASETADAMGFMAMAGFDAQKIMKALPGVLELSSASMLDVASAADIATNIMSGFGVEAEDLGRVNDVLVKALTSSNVDLTELGQAMKFVGPVAQGLGISIEETAAAIGAMGDAGLKGGIAGRNLRGIITKMIKPSKEAKKLFNDLGITLVDNKGNFVGLTNAVRQFEAANVNAVQATEAFGESATVLNVLMNKGADNLEDFTKKLEESGGTAKSISDRQMATLQGGIKQLGSSFEDLRIIIGDNIAPAVASFAKGLKSLIDSFRAAPKPIQEMASTLIALAGTIGIAGAALAITASKLALASAATTGWTAAITGGLAVALKGIAVALVPVGVALAGLVISFKAVQAITGDTTPFFQTVADAMDRAQESAHAFRTTMHNLGLAVGDAAIKMVTLNGLFGLVDMDRLTGMSERSAARFSDASFEAEHFGGSVVDASRKAADALSEVRDMAARDRRHAIRDPENAKHDRRRRHRDTKESRSRAQESRRRRKEIQRRSQSRV
jgi:TP901 family phage tail tape measure protein